MHSLEASNVLLPSMAATELAAFATARARIPGAIMPDRSDGKAGLNARILRSNGWFKRRELETGTLRRIGLERGGVVVQPISAGIVIFKKMVLTLDVVSDDRERGKGNRQTTSRRRTILERARRYAAQPATG